MAEIVSTEKSYLHGLEIMHKHFMLPLKSAMDTGKLAISNEQLQSIFFLLEVSELPQRAQRCCNFLFYYY